MKYLKRYRELSEGLKDKMTGLSISDAHHMIKKYGVKDRLTYIIHNDMVELFDQTVKEATDSDEDYLINEELLQMAINENSFDVFKKMVNDYPETIPSRERELIDYIFDDIIFFEHYHFLEELLKSDKVKEVLSEYNFKKYTHILNNRVNEGLKDKMTGKGEEDIIKRAEHITTEDKIFNGIKYDIFELVEMGVSEIKNDKKLLSEKGHLLLRFAVISGNMEAAKLLLDLDLDVNYSREVLLRSAAFKQDKNMTDLLISYGADLDRAIRVEPYEKTIGADISSVPISYLNSIKFLKDYKEKYVINEGLRHKMTGKREEELEEYLDTLGPVELLDKSAKSNYEKGVIKALKQGADNEFYINKAMASMADNNNMDMVKLLLDYGADITYSDDYVLRSSAQRGNLDMIKLALDGGADINANSGEALKFAIEEGHVKVVEFLLDNGAKFIDYLHYFNDILRFTMERGTPEVLRVVKKHLNKK